MQVSWKFNRLVVLTTNATNLIQLYLYNPHTRLLVYYLVRLSFLPRRKTRRGPIDKIHLFYVGKITFANSNSTSSIFSRHYPVRYRPVRPPINVYFLLNKGFVPIALSLLTLTMAVWFDSNKKEFEFSESDS